MSQTRPYQFGDVVDGHRWTVAGWERIDPPAPERRPRPSPSRCAPCTPHPTCGSSSTRASPTSAAPSCRTSTSPSTSRSTRPRARRRRVRRRRRPGPQRLAHHDEDTHTWSDAAWEAIDE
ncbi:MAG: hypothetical protein U0S36_10590 [Candidatus Nanopelagicales bacterium]